MAANDYQDDHIGSSQFFHLRFEGTRLLLFIIEVLFGIYRKASKITPKVNNISHNLVLNKDFL
jgi:hypothetical protein